MTRGGRLGLGLGLGLGLSLGWALGWAGDARASGFDAPQVGPARSNAVTADAAAIHHNPGQLGYLDRPELMVGVGIIVGTLGYQRDRLGQYQYADNLDFAEPVDMADIDPTKTGSAEAIRSTSVGPNLGIFFAMPVVPERFTMGVGLTLPYAAVVDAPRDGPQRFAGQGLLLASAHATLSAAVRLHDVISIGAGVSYVLSAIELSKVQDFGAVAAFGETLEGDPIAQDNDFGPDAPSTVRELDVLARPIEIGLSPAHSVSFNAGIALRPTDALDIGLVYQHGAKARFRGRFRLDMNDEFFTQDLAAQGLQYPPVVEGDAELVLRLPKRVALGVGYQIVPRFRLDAVGQYVSYQDFNRVDIELRSPDLAQPELGVSDVVRQPLPRDWVGVGIVELTGKIDATDRLGLTVLGGYHSPASPDATIDMASPDGHRIVYGVGLGYAFSPKFTLLVDVEGHSIVPRTVTASDYDLGNGTYRLFIAHVGLTAQARFGRRGNRPPGPPGLNRPPGPPGLNRKGKRAPPSGGAGNAEERSPADADPPAPAKPDPAPDPEKAPSPAIPEETPNSTPDGGSEPPPPPPPPPPDPRSTTA